MPSLPPIKLAIILQIIPILLSVRKPPLILPIPEEDSQGQKLLIKICFRRSLVAFQSSNTSFGTSNHNEINEGLEVPKEEIDDWNAIKVLRKHVLINPDYPPPPLHMHGTYMLQVT